MRSALFLAASSLCLGGCDTAAGRRSAELRFKVTADVLVGRVHRLGTATWSYKAITAALPLATRNESLFVAESIPIDAGGGRWLFVLPRNRHFSGSGADWSTTAFGLTRFSGDAWDAAFDRLSRSPGRSASVACVEDGKNVMGRFTCPTILESRHIADPLSFREVAGPLYRRAGVVPDVRIASMRFEVTTDPVSHRLEGLLPWLAAAQRDHDRNGTPRLPTRGKELPSQVSDIRTPLIH